MAHKSEHCTLAAASAAASVRTHANSAEEVLYRKGLESMGKREGKKIYKYAYDECILMKRKELYGDEDG